MALYCNIWRCTLDRFASPHRAAWIGIANVERNRTRLGILSLHLENVANADSGNSIGCCRSCAPHFRQRESTRPPRQSASCDPPSAFHRRARPPPAIEMRRLAGAAMLFTIPRRSPQRVEQRTLLDVATPRILVIAFFEFHILKGFRLKPLSGETSSTVSPSPSSICQRRQPEEFPKATGSPGSRCRSRRLFRGEYEKFNRVLGAESAPAAARELLRVRQNSNDTVVFGRHWESHQCANQCRRQVPQDGSAPRPRNISDASCRTGETDFLQRAIIQGARLRSVGVKTIRVTAGAPRSEMAPTSQFLISAAADQFPISFFRFARGCRFQFLLNQIFCGSFPIAPNHCGHQVPSR